LGSTAVSKSVVAIVASVRNKGGVARGAANPLFVPSN
jgi:hypothetical protein